MRSVLSASMFPTPTLTICAGASWRHGGPPTRPSPINPRACSWRSSKDSSAIGARTMTCEREKLNALPMFVTEIDGLDIQFIHVRSRHENAMPLIMTHGWPGPRSWVERSYDKLIYFNEVDKGGHFAAWEEPELFSTEVRAAFRSLR